MERFVSLWPMFIFKRKDTVLRIIDRIREVKPKTFYIIADAGRNDEEKALVRECREAVEKAIDWECNLIKNYAKENRGVHAQIGMGALWVFEREERAIFLEDDNLPEVLSLSIVENAWTSMRRMRVFFGFVGQTICRNVSRRIIRPYLLQGI